MTMRLSRDSMAFFFGALALGLGAIACSQDPPGATGGGGSDGGSGGDAAPADGPVYAVASVKLNTSGEQGTYVILSDKLTGELRLEDASLEIAGVAGLTGIAGGNRLYVGTQSNTEVKRYDLSADGKKLVESGSINFGAAGVSTLGEYDSAFQFVDAHKAYLYTPGRIVVWDPEEMVLSGTSIAIPQTIRQNPEGGNYTATLTGAPLRDGDTIYFFTAWDSRAVGVIKIPSASSIVALDTVNDTAQVFVDERCGYARDGVIDGDYIYVVSESLLAGVHFLNPANGGAPCMIRFHRTERQFDPSYLVDLTTLAGGAPVGSLVTSPGGKAFVYVLDTALAEAAIGADPQLSNARLLSVGSYWKTAALTVGDTPSLQLLDNPLTTAAVLPHALKDGVKTAATFDTNDLELREITDRGVLPTERVGAKLFGRTYSVVQLR